MKLKKDNNLIKVVCNGEIIGYYSSPNRAGIKCGKAAASILWHLSNKGSWKDYDDNVWEIGIVDGSNITYDMINN